MQGKVHLGLGIASGLVFGATLFNSTTDIALFTVSSAIGSILPDIDSATSMVGRKAPVISFFVRIIGGHRGLIHTPFAMVMFFIISLILRPIFNIPWFCIAAFLMGYLLHLLQDTFTKRGIMYLFPINKKYFSLLSIHKSGRFALLEYIISGAMLFIIYILCNL